MEKFKAILKLTILIVILIGIPVYIWIFHSDIISDFSNIEKLESYFKAHKGISIFIYILAQALQIIICFIPGQWLQIAASYLYGFWLGVLFSVIGAVIGSFFAYHIARILGRDAVHMIFGEEKIAKMVERMNTKQADIIVFFIFLIPGIPKDLCAYAAGISEFKLRPFLIISTLGRLPAVMGSLFIGQSLANGEYTSAIIVAIIAIVLFVLGIVFHKRLSLFIDKFYKKIQ